LGNTIGFARFIVFSVVFVRGSRLKSSQKFDRALIGKVDKSFSVSFLWGLGYHPRFELIVLSFERKLNSKAGDTSAGFAILRKERSKMEHLKFYHLLSIDK